MKSLIGILFICLLGGCALLKRKVAVDRQTASSVITLAESEKLRKQTQYSRTDSGYIETSFEVFPKGKFSYSPSKGFEGEAGRMVVTERTAKLVREEKELVVDKSRESAFRQQTKQEHATKQVETKRISFWWLGIIVAGAALAYGYHKLKFKLFNY